MARHDNPAAGGFPPAASPAALASAGEALAVLAFWRDAGAEHWFAKDPVFDRRFHDRCLLLHEAAVDGALAGWAALAPGALALVLLLDQFPRNAFRGTPRMYESDDLAREVAAAAIAAGHDEEVEPDLRLFFYLPFAHSEDLADQIFSVRLSRALGEPHATRALHHRDIIKRFGRFPHRNPILGRPSTDAERRYLAEGGFNG